MIIERKAVRTCADALSVRHITLHCSVANIKILSKIWEMLEIIIFWCDDEK